MSLLTKQPVGECFSFTDFSAGFNVEWYYSALDLIYRALSKTIDFY